MCLTVYVSLCVCIRLREWVLCVGVRSAEAAVFILFPRLFLCLFGVWLLFPFALSRLVVKWRQLTETSWLRRKKVEESIEEGEMGVVVCAVMGVSVEECGCL